MRGLPWGREKFRPRYPLVPRMTAGQQAAIVASAQDWAKAQGSGRPESGQSCPLSTTKDRAAASGAHINTQKMADKVAKESPELAKQVASGLQKSYFFAFLNRSLLFNIDRYRRNHRSRSGLF